MTSRLTESFSLYQAKAFLDSFDDKDNSFSMYAFTSNSLPIDNNENNSTEILIFDKDFDGRPDLKWIDRDDIPNPTLTNEEWMAKWDAIAVDIDQDGTWDKVKEIPKS